MKSKFTMFAMSLAFFMLTLPSAILAFPLFTSPIETTVKPTKTLVMAADTLSKRHNYAMDCGALRTYCNKQGYYCDGSGLLSYQFTENQTCNHACKCVNINPVPRPPVITVKPCVNVILGFCEDVKDTEAKGNGTVGDAVESGEAV